MYPPLPIDPLVPEILGAVRSHDNVVLTATPGAGKTTRLPPALLDCVPGQIFVLQPRRLAAVSACERVCLELGTKVGDLVGYRVRFESRAGPKTRLTFMTDALLLRRLIDDPELRGVDLVVLDEFHERTLNQDLILGLLRELQEMGRAIKIVIMSATLDVPRTLAYLPNSAHVDVPGRVFPLEIQFAREAARVRTDPEFVARVGEAVRQAAPVSRDILVFLPGVGEINRVRAHLQAGPPLGRDVVILHGSLNLRDQQKVLAPSQRPRVILSTNVAEASVTVPGVDCVIDSGLARSASLNPRSGFTGLDLVRISKFNARQRAGRAGREKAGRCHRLWNEFDDVALPDEPAPEVTREDLTQALLMLAHSGVTDFARFAWFDPPTTSAIDWATRALTAFGALDQSARPTALGRTLLGFPLPPRWGALLASGGGPVFAKAAALLNERDIVDRGDFTTGLECDVTLRLELLEESGWGGEGLDARALDQVREVARQLERLAPGRGTVEDLRKALLLSQKDRLCRRRGAAGRGVMVGGRGVKLEPGSQVRASEFFLALAGIDLAGQPETTVRIASGYSKDDVLRVLKDDVIVDEDVYFDEARGGFMARRRRRIFDLELEEPSVRPVPAGEVGAKLGEALRDRWPWIVAKDEDLGRWWTRWQYLTRHAPEFATHFGVAEQENFMLAATTGRATLSSVLAQDLVALLEGLLPREVTRAMQNEVPSHFAAPSGVRHAISYEGELGAFVEVRLQEMFGCAQAPRLVFGRTTLAFRLLGPNFRPVQVTSDLANFWASGYDEVRKQLRARYPKHAWPEDPLSARPEARGRRRS